MATSTNVQATKGSIQQSSNHSNSNSLVNSQNTYQYLFLLPESMKNLKIDTTREGQPCELSDDSPESSAVTPRASTSSFPQNRQSEERGVSFSPTPSQLEPIAKLPQVQPMSEAREKGYMASMRSGIYPNSKVKIIRLTHEIRLPLPKYTPDNVIDYMRTLPRRQMDLIPLWSPSPSEERPREVIVGDVGIFNQQGGFETKFNIFSTDNRSEGLDPPPDFVSFGPAKEHVTSIDKNWQAVCGLSADVVGSKYSCTPEGSTQLLNTLPDWAKGYCSSLYLPYGGRKHCIETSAFPNVMQYAAAQAPSWYCFKNTAENGEHLLEKYDELRNRSFIVVTEVWKTSTWYSIQTEEPSDLKSLSSPHQRRRIKVTVQKPTDSKSRMCTHTCDSGFVVHTGPESSVLQGREDQCVALKGFQLIYDPKLPLFSPTSERKGVGDGSSILSRLSFFSRKSRKTKRG